MQESGQNVDDAEKGQRSGKVIKFGWIQGVLVSGGGGLVGVGVLLDDVTTPAGDCFSRCIRVSTLKRRIKVPLCFSSS